MVEVTISIYCREKLVEVLERRRVEPSDELTIESKGGGGKINIKVDRFPTGVEGIDVRINISDDAITNPGMVPPTATRTRKLGFDGL